MMRNNLVIKAQKRDGTVRVVNCSNNNPQMQFYIGTPIYTYYSTSHNNKKICTPLMRLITNYEVMMG